MITMVENEKSTDQGSDQPIGEMDTGFSSVDARFDKVQAGMREGFGRVNQDIRDLRGEMNTRFLALETDIKVLHRTIIGATVATIAALIGVVGAIMAASLSGIIALLVVLL